MDYIRSLEAADNSQGGCFICQAAASLGDAAKVRQLLVLWYTPHVIVLMNKFPYTNGHLMVTPREHVANLDELPRDVLVDLQVQTSRAVSLLRATLRPQGFNIGINLGHCAGAGLPGHLHQHVVPRWAGDVNFMSVVGTVRVQPQAMEQIYAELLEKYLAMEQG